MSILKRFAAAVSIGLLSFALVACSSSSDAGYKRMYDPASQSQSSQGDNLAQSGSGSIPGYPDVLSGDLEAVDNEDGTTTYTYMSAIITVPSTGNMPDENRNDVSWGMTVDVPNGMTVSMSLVNPTDGLSVDSYTQRIVDTVDGSQATSVKVKGATYAKKIFLGNGKAVAVVATNGSEILIGSASSSWRDVYSADEIVSTMRFGE